MLLTRRRGDCTVAAAKTKATSTEAPSTATTDAEESDGVELLSPAEETFEARLLREAIQRASSVDEKPAEAERVKWSKIKERLRPTQAALGYDWCFYKLKNFTSEAAAQRYMDSKARAETAAGPCLS